MNVAMERAVSPSCRTEADDVAVVIGCRQCSIKGVAASVMLLAGVRVAVESHEGAAVTEPFVHVFECQRSLLTKAVDQQARVGAPNFVEPNGWDAGISDRPAPVVACSSSHSSAPRHASTTARSREPPRHERWVKVSSSL